MISVIVPAYNEEAFIGKCIASLEKQSLAREDYEIIVSDSSSTDRTLEIAERHSVKIVKCKKRSAGFARNAGARKARGKTLAFIDADTVASRQWLEGVKEGLEKNIACTGPIRALERDSLLLSAYFRWWSFQSKLTVKLGFPVFPGFNFAVSRNAFEKAGGFLTKNITTEDFDLSLKLRKLGRVGFNKKMLVFSSTRRFRERSIFFPVKNAWSYVLFGRSHGWEKHRSDFEDKN